MRFSTLPGALLLTLLTAAPLPADDLRLSLWVAPTHAVSHAFEAWSTSLSEATNGRLTPTLFTAGQLGIPADHYDMARDGVVDMAMIAPPDYPDRFPILQLAEIPFTFSDSVQGVAVLHEWYQPLAEIEMPDVKLCLMTMYHPATFHTAGKPVRVPKDLNKLKIRTYNRTTARFAAAQGAAAVQVSVPVLREILENGVVDGIGFPWDVGTAEVRDLLTFHVDLPIYIGVQVYVLNRAYYNALPDDRRSALDAHCTPDWSARLSKEWSEQSKAARDVILGDPTHEVYAPTAEEMTHWLAAAEATARESVAALGQADIDGTVILENLRAKLKAAGAGF